MRRCEVRDDTGARRVTTLMSPYKLIRLDPREEYDFASRTEAESWLAQTARARSVDAAEFASEFKMRPTRPCYRVWTTGVRGESYAFERRGHLAYWMIARAASDEAAKSRRVEPWTMEEAAAAVRRRERDEPDPQDHADAFLSEWKFARGPANGVMPVLAKRRVSCPVPPLDRPFRVDESGLAPVSDAEEEWRLHSGSGIWVSSLGRVAQRRHGAPLAILPLAARSAMETPYCLASTNDGRSARRNVRRLVSNAFFGRACCMSAPDGSPWDNRVCALQAAGRRVAHSFVATGVAEDLAAKVDSSESETELD